MFYFFSKDINIVSGNRRHGTHPRYIMNKEYLGGLFAAANPEGWFFDHDISIEINIITKKDIDNPLKATFDALKFAGIISDDKEITRIIINKQHENIKNDIFELRVETYKNNSLAYLKNKEVKQLW